MRNAIGIALLVSVVLAGGGCATYQAYAGKKRPRSEVAIVAVPWTTIVVDGEAVPKQNVSKITLLPGRHVIEWDWVYPNNYPQTNKLSFDAEPGQSYHLGQRFFAAPHPGGPIGAVVDLAVDTAMTPITLLFPPEAPTDPPAGEYYMWIVHREAQRVVAGLAPDVPLAHAPITYVPVHEEE